jgi:hypothetical protein
VLIFLPKQNVKLAASGWIRCLWNRKCSGSYYLLEGKVNVNQQQLTRAEFKTLDFPEFDFSDVKGQEKYQALWKLQLPEDIILYRLLAPENDVSQAITLVFCRR